MSVMTLQDHLARWILGEKVPQRVRARYRERVKIPLKCLGPGIVYPLPPLSPHALHSCSSLIDPSGRLFSCYETCECNDAFQYGANSSACACLPRVNLNINGCSIVAPPARPSRSSRASLTDSLLSHTHPPAARRGCPAGRESPKFSNGPL